MTRRRGLVVCLGVSLAIGLAAVATLPRLAGAMTSAPIDATRSLYLLRCAGCHGIQGVSVPKSIPTLRGHVGVFLCSAEGRDYLLRLPNIQMALIRDDKDLADVLNFVVFDLGGRSAPEGAKPFSKAEVAASRGHPLDAATIASRRDTLIQTAGSCAAPYRTDDEAPFSGPY